MNEFSNETSGRYARAGIRHARHLHHVHRRVHRRLHRLNRGFGDGADFSCRERGERSPGHRRGREGRGRPGGFTRRVAADR